MQKLNRTLLNKCTNWLDPRNITRLDIEGPLYFRDPLYGSVRLMPQLTEFILHPIFQRLNEVFTSQS